MDLHHLIKFFEKRKKNAQSRVEKTRYEITIEELNKLSFDNRHIQKKMEEFMIDKINFKEKLIYNHKILIHNIKPLKNCNIKNKNEKDAKKNIYDINFINMLLKSNNEDRKLGLKIKTLLNDIDVRIIILNLEDQKVHSKNIILINACKSNSITAFEVIWSYMRKNYEIEIDDYEIKLIKTAIKYGSIKIVKLLSKEMKKSISLFNRIMYLVILYWHPLIFEIITREYSDFIDENEELQGRCRQRPFLFWIYTQNNYEAWRSFCSFRTRNNNSIVSFYDFDHNKCMIKDKIKNWI